VRAAALAGSSFAADAANNSNGDETGVADMPKA
jgi:hypothetical protein